MYLLSVLAGEAEKSYPLKDAGVVGIPDEEFGEVPRAFIVRAPSSTITGGPIILKLVRFFKIVDCDIGPGGSNECSPEEAICKEVAERMATYKQLKGGVVFLEVITSILEPDFLTSFFHILY